MSLFLETQHVGAYDVIAADPPWLFNGYHQKKHGGAADHYEGLALAEICAIPVAELAAPNCALVLWCTPTHEVEGDHTEVIKAWGFRPVTRLLYWRKTYEVCVCGHPEAEHLEPGYATVRKKGKLRRFLSSDTFCDRFDCGCGHHTPKPYCGCGSYTRQSLESAWLGIKGSMPVLDRGIRDEIVAPVREHSAKPREFFERVEKAWPKAKGKLELFCRGKPQPGWKGWGNECLGGTDVFGPEVGQEWPRDEAPAPTDQQVELWGVS